MNEEREGLLVVDEYEEGVERKKKNNSRSELQRIPDVVKLELHIVLVITHPKVGCIFDWIYYFHFKSCPYIREEGRRESMKFPKNYKTSNLKIILSLSVLLILITEIHTITLF